MPVVDVPDVGEVEFPDEMSPSEIESALKAHYPADRATQKLRLADEMSKLRRQGFLGEQGQAMIGAAENIAKVASIPATPILRLPRSEGTDVGSGLLNVGANVAESLSAPAYWLMPGSKPLQALVAGQTLGSVPQSTVRAAQTLLNPSATKAQKVEAVADPLLAAGAGALITKGAVRANDQIQSPSGIPVEQQGVPVDRGTEGQSETGTPQRGGEGEQAVPQPSEVPKEVVKQANELSKEPMASGERQVEEVPKTKTPEAESTLQNITEHASSVRALDDGSLLGSDGNVIKPGNGIKLSFMGGPSDMPTPWTLVRAENYPSTVNYKLNPRVIVRAANGQERTYNTANVYSPRKSPPSVVAAGESPEAPSVSSAEVPEVSKGPLEVFRGGPPNALESNWPKWFTTDKERAAAYGKGRIHEATVNPENPFYSKVTLSIEDVERLFQQGHDAIIIGSKGNPIDVIVPSQKSAGLQVRGEAPPANVEPNVTPEVTQAPLSQGPGAASPGDVPPDPRMADAIENNPEVRPLGPTSPASIGINNAINGVWDWVKGVAGQSMPKTTTADRAVGEAGVRYASSRIAAKPLADSFAAHALEGTDVDPVKFGAALTEDNLRSVREALRQKATELGANGDLEGAALAADKGNQVASIIGAKGSPFKTEDAYFDFLSDPATQRAIGQHVQLWKEIIEPQYKQAQSLDPNIELPTRGQQTGARINLKAILPDEPATRPVSGVGSPNLTGTFKKKTPFSITAKGTGQAYDINYGDIIANTFTRQLEIANKNAFDDALVKSGNAVIDSPGQTISLKGEPAVPFPIVRKSIVTGGQTIPMSQNIYVRKSLANEYRTASNVNERHSLGFVTKVMGGINRLALAGLTDFSVHTSNLLTAIFNRPTSAKLFGDTLLSATGRADIPVTLTKAILKGLKDNREQVAELSNIGAMRPQEPSGWAGRILRSVDKTTRLVLDDTFKSLAKEGIVPDTETARREYVNQVGQYNRRLQGPLTRWLRETGFGPFVTAGKTFNALGVKMATLSPGSKATSLPAAAALRANVLSKWVGASVLAASLNYLLTKKVGGRPGTPIGSVDFGTNDKTGKQQSFPLFSLIGLGRGLRVTGIKGFAEAKRLGLSTADAIDTAARDIFNSWVAPAAGPPVKALVVGGSGYPPAVKVGRASRVAPPGSSQLAENVKEAAIEVNPLVQSISKVREGKPVSEAISGQLPRLSMTPGKSEGMVANYPKIVTLARANEFTEDVIFQARRLPFEERRAFVTEQINRLPPELRQKARNEVARRKVYNRQ